ncbi:MAG: hypothetical protein JW750_03995 [Anaerolineaceae bacterium]|nr:hypothetical protein [Anaerolineaceae bacterium]
MDRILIKLHLVAPAGCYFVGMKDAVFFGLGEPRKGVIAVAEHHQWQVRSWLAGLMVLKFFNIKIDRQLIRGNQLKGNQIMEVKPVSFWGIIHY